MTWHPAYNSHSLVACKGNKDYGIPLNWTGMDFCRYFPFSVQFNSYQTSLMEFVISSSWDKFLKSIKLRLLYADKGLQCLEYQRARHCSISDLWNKKQSIEVNDKNRNRYNVSKKKISLQISRSIFLGKKMEGGITIPNVPALSKAPGGWKALNTQWHEAACSALSSWVSWGAKRDLEG